MKNKPKYKKTAFNKWTNYKDLLTFPEKLIGKKLLVVIKGHYKELVIEDVASVDLAEFNADEFSVLLLDEHNKWHSLLGCQIKFVLEEIEYDEDADTVKGPDKSENEDFKKQIEKFSEEWKKMRPYKEPEPYKRYPYIPPYPNNYPPYIPRPQYPGWQPDVWCQSESSPFNSGSPYKRY